MAAQGGLSLLDAGQRPRRYGFALTPLADAMFQLLIFFMLSSTLSPYSLIALTGGAAAGQSAITGQADAQAQSPSPDDALVIWHLSRGQIRAGDQSLPLSDLASLMPALEQQGIDEVLVFPTRSATVQDIATVLEVLGLHGVAKVRLVAGSQVGGG
ncbi:biopolymer transporter ExbD [Pseudorhodobacter sp. E13]|uniref:ExbD/TolR family protein n=1 Tax=Pseudorhodobacter sp. E13 TaxID=2487931 RepID=UPI000F8DDCA3|nr:biopolymer transporter ExbD [Pseudorhodobacter sp. E13]RUS63328.1 biopolymer transporter ExbD [Pseudorhodobacter sp. E13]